MNKDKSILLFSGGLDSFIAWHYLGRPTMLFIDANQSYVKKELKTVKYLAKKNKAELIIDSSFDLSRWEEKNFYIPYRNVFFAMIASIFAPLVYLIGIKGDSVDDNNSRITPVMSSFLNNFNYNKRVKITSPFYNMTKSQIVKWYIGQGLPLDDLLQTRSCYDRKSVGHCGRCSSCFRRWVAMENNGIREHYDQNPWEWAEARKYRKKMAAGLYDQERAEETLQALNKYEK
jgi:7-cyano-7-deazaguanine synthase in queuosine biosynthesis